MGHAGLQDLIPHHKSDLERARAARQAGPEQVRPILGELLQWLGDRNWPVAADLIPLFIASGSYLIPHLQRVFSGDDGWWKYNCLITVVAEWPVGIQEEMRSDLERLAASTQSYDIDDEVPLMAREILASLSD